jgi:hypothetical protein
MVLVSSLCWTFFWLAPNLWPMKRIYLARDITQAQLVVNLLEQEFIPAKIENAHQSSGLGELAVSYPEIWVIREADAERARSIVEVFETQNQAQIADTVCPECEEINPANFDLCWACAADLK